MRQREVTMQRDHLQPHYNLEDLPIGERAPEIVNVIVEIPKGARNKYEYDPSYGVFKLDRVLYSAVHYPAAYGFIPSTYAPDGDAMDVLVLTSEPTFTGCLLTARPIGMMTMYDEKGLDEKVLAVSDVDPYSRGVNELDDLRPHFTSEVEHFFGVYKDLEAKEVDIRGWAEREVTLERIREYMEVHRSRKEGGR
jgi:inorganic pyrophosphatase